MEKQRLQNPMLLSLLCKMDLIKLNGEEAKPKLLTKTATLILI